MTGSFLRSVIFRTKPDRGQNQSVSTAHYSKSYYGVVTMLTIIYINSRRRHYKESISLHSSPVSTPFLKWLRNTLKWMKRKSNCTPKMSAQKSLSESHLSFLRNWPPIHYTTSPYPVRRIRQLNLHSNGHSRGWGRSLTFLEKLGMWYMAMYSRGSSTKFAAWIKARKVWHIDPVHKRWTAQRLIPPSAVAVAFGITHDASEAMSAEFHSTNYPRVLQQYYLLANKSMKKHRHFYTITAHSHSHPYELCLLFSIPSEFPANSPSAAFIWSITQPANLTWQMQIKEKRGMIKSGCIYAGKYEMSCVTWRNWVSFSQSMTHP